MVTLLGDTEPKVETMELKIISNKEKVLIKAQVDFNKINERIQRLEIRLENKKKRFPNYHTIMVSCSTIKQLKS